LHEKDSRTAHRKRTSATATVPGGGDVGLGNFDVGRLPGEFIKAEIVRVTGAVRIGEGRVLAGREGEDSGEEEEFRVHGC
jgi:hypothetical protein